MEKTIHFAITVSVCIWFSEPLNLMGGVQMQDSSKDFLEPVCLLNQ
jgi:hypothetical protein